MLFVIERHAINIGTKFIRRFCTKIIDRSVENPYKNEESQEFHNDSEILHDNEKKLLKIAILGEPNAGKSTLINYLVSRRLCPTSSKAHTTKSKSEVIYTENNTQLIFIDTPGIVMDKEHKKFKLTHNFKDDPKRSLKADVIGIIQDVANKYTRHKIHNTIVELLNENHDRIQNKLLLLILNKVDRIKDKRSLLDLVKQLNGQDARIHFNEVFMISALTGDGVDDLKNYLLDCAKPNKWEYTESTYTDQGTMNIIQQTVRAKLLDNLPNEVPYRLSVKVQDIEVLPDGSLKVLVMVVCRKIGVRHLILGHGGKRIKLIATAIEEDLRNAFRTQVAINLDVSIQK